MRATLRLTWTRIAGGLAALVMLGVVGALIVAWSGVYSIAASRGHPGWLNWFLEFGMRRSVEANAPDLKAPDLSDPGLVALGASHFQGGCAPCHGAPGEPVNPIYKGMLPEPPKLQGHADHWTPQELHWIVKHGLQYAGMPGWAATERDDEVWAVVAFLEALPEMSEETYRSLASGNAVGGEPGAAQLIASGVTVTSLATCSKCHDTAGRPPTSSRVPRLGGQSAAYLARTLREYRGNHRQSGFMEPVAAEIPREEIDAIAALFSDLGSPSHPQNTLPGADLEAGREIALNGLPGRRVAACQACHDGNARATYPRLAGQSAEYLKTQLELWRGDPPSDTAYADIMAAAIGKMRDDEIRDVAAWYASQPPFGTDPASPDEPGGDGE